MDRIVFHIDANSAFLSWQAAYDLQHGATLDIRTVPSVIGGNQATRHGIVLAKSSLCKPFKITTGETLMSARQKCPNLLVVPPNYFVYSICSKAMFDILREYTPKLQIFSIDEGFLDFSGMESLFGKDPVETATVIKERIKKELGFTVSVGISNNKLLAKMASEFKKPDGVATCFPNEIKDKLWPLPVRELYGVGRATEEKLLKYDIKTIGDIANAQLSLLKHLFKSYGVILYEFSNGKESSMIHEGHTTGNHTTIKGMGNSCTSHFDITEKEDAYLNLLSLTETVSMRLRFGGFAARVISVYIRTTDLNGYGHQRKLLAPIDTTEAIFEVVKELFDDSWKKEPIRGLGVRATDLYTDYTQISFFEKDWTKQRQVNKAIDEIRIKYGSDSIVRGVFLWSGIKSMQGGLGGNDYPGMSSTL
jgi:DNA polymerase IV